MKLESGSGDVTVYIPERLHATIDAIVDRPALNSQRIFSDFPMNGLVSTAPSRRSNPRNSMPAGNQINRFTAPTHEQYLLEGGGNSIQLHTSLGKIEIFKIKL